MAKNPQNLQAQATETLAKIWQCGKSKFKVTPVAENKVEISIGEMTFLEAYRFVGGLERASTMGLKGVALSTFVTEEDGEAPPLKNKKQMAIELLPRRTAADREAEVAASKRAGSVREHGTDKPKHSYTIMVQTHKDINVLQTIAEVDLEKMQRVDSARKSIRSSNAFNGKKSFGRYSSGPEGRGFERRY